MKIKNISLKNVTYILVLSMIFVLFLTGYSLGRNVRTAIIKWKSGNSKSDCRSIFKSENKYNR